MVKTAAGHEFIRLTPDLKDYDRLTVGRLREALAELDPDLPIRSGYYSCHGVTMCHYADGRVEVDINNSE